MTTTSAHLPAPRDRGSAGSCAAPAPADNTGAAVITKARLTPRLCCAAIGKAWRGLFRRPQPAPAIDTSANTIQTPDRVVNVLMSLNSPRVVLLGNLLSDEECDALIAYGTERFARSTVVGRHGSVVDARRTSQGVMAKRAETETIARIEARLAALMQWPVERGEGLQVLRYEKTNQYRPHYDWFNPLLSRNRTTLARGGQRLATLVMYLSDVEAGGGTTFPKVGLQLRPQKGCAVFFANTDPYGACDLRSLHAGDPVVSGVKFVATKWLRKEEFVEARRAKPAQAVPPG
jgi:prolyl 4-hydroxylase